MTEYRIDDLAHRAGVSVRNVRVYQDRGLLSPPRKQGRTGWYDESHLVRLNLIGRMLDRGYTFVTISELLAAAQYGLQVKDVLETEDPHNRWKTYGDTTRLTSDELRELFGEQSTEANIERGAALGALKDEGSEFAVSSPRLVEAAQLLVDAGIPLEGILEQAEAVRKDLGDVAARFVALVTDRYLGDEGEPLDLDASTVSQIAELVSNLRPLARDAVQALFAEAMETQISKALAQATTQLEATPSLTDDVAETG